MFSVVDMTNASMLRSFRVIAVVILTVTVGGLTTIMCTIAPSFSLFRFASAVSVARER